MRWILTCLMLLAMFVAGCDEGKTKQAPVTGASTMGEMSFTEENHARLIKAVPPPRLKDSLERRNLTKYLEYWNKPDRMSYLYLVSRSGTVLSHYTIVGKITYCRSKLTTQDQLVKSPFRGRYRESGVNLTSKIESPGLDGSYGPSEDAIFFFTTENPEVPVVWKGDYLVSGVPMQISTKPVLVRTIK